jgi:hypothetical protein
MLRAVGIPSRLVSGFKGGQKNALSGAYVVEQRHAHAWVEAWIDDHWVTFDPTPPSRSESVAEMRSGIQSWRDFGQILQNFWLQNVVSIDGNRQRELIYQPIQKMARSAVASLKNLGELAKRLWHNVSTTIRSPKKWFSWQGGAISFVLLLLLSGIVWVVRRLWAFVRRRRREGSGAVLIPRVAFYERFAKALAASGFVRVQSQTQREFADEIQQELQTRLVVAGVADLPVDVSRLFYQVRFGGRDLSPDEAAHIDTELTRFESCLAGVDETAETPAT